MGVIEPSATELDVARLYESEVRDRTTGLGVRFITLPAAAFDRPDNLGDAEEAMRLLEVRPISHIDPSLAAYVIASLLLKDDADAVAEHFELVLEHPGAFAADHSDVLAFAEYVTYADLVPIEHSPLSADSLTALATAGSGVALGLMIAGGPTPLLLVTAPLGIILVGSAKGIAAGLEGGLRYRILKLMGVPPDAS